MREIIVIIGCIFIASCSETEWTEGYYYSGFKNGYESKVKYKTGGHTKITVNVSSAIFKELLYPITLNIVLNDNICASKTISKASKKLLFSAFCEVNLGSGLHVFKASLVSPNNFKNITEKQDLESNEFHGSITYTLEE